MLGASFISSLFFGVIFDRADVVFSVAFSCKYVGKKQRSVVGYVEFRRDRVAPPPAPAATLGVVLWNLYSTGGAEAGQPGEYTRFGCAPTPV